MTAFDATRAFDATIPFDGSASVAGADDEWPLQWLKGQGNQTAWQEWSPEYVPSKGRKPKKWKAKTAVRAGSIALDSEVKFLTTEPALFPEPVALVVKKRKPFVPPPAPGPRKFKQRTKGVAIGTLTLEASTKGKPVTEKWLHTMKIRVGKLVVSHELRWWDVELMRQDDERVIQAVMSAMLGRILGIT